ncbi:hypothetical protein CRG98_001236 [Punica granatum]|uniref:Uncharacterized protein n=1 Tax=Punica granatum TaxID=22663 RepID=A0A2I0LCG1_PUNGR|nr:hypothetical protein CRG98_001236 [Punica granatum]
MRGGWPGWMASGHSKSHHGEVKTTGGLPAKAVRTRMWTLIGARIARFWIARLGRLSTFPCRRMTDTPEKESPLIILRPEGRGRITYPGSRGMEQLVVVEALICVEPKSSSSGVHVMCGPISRTPFRLDPHGKQVRKDNKLQNVIPSLGVRGKSRGSVRESSDSVECLEGCSSTKDARSGNDGRAAVLGYCSPESTVFARNEEINLK